MWSEEQTAMLWSYVEKFQLQLYHGKDNMTRPQIIAKITALLSECLPCTCVQQEMSSISVCFSFCTVLFADTHLDLDINRKQVDDKVYHMERRFKSRKAARYSGAADQSYWPMEDRVAAVCGKLKCIVESQINCGIH